MQPTTTRVRGPVGRLVAVAVAASTAVTVAIVVPPASADEDPSFGRGIDLACEQRAQQVGRFPDVDPNGVHAGAIDCLATYGIVQGRLVDGAFVYDPHSAVTRQQMATFVSAMLRGVPDRNFALPDVDEPDFLDAEEIAPVHRPNVAALQEAGIVAGYAEGTFRPAQAIDRAQMASYLARAIEQATDVDLSRVDVFGDLAGPHRANVEKLAAIGVVQGRGDGTYRPGGSTTRGQMATVVARSLDHLVAEGLLVPLSFAAHSEATTLGLTDVHVDAREGFDRASFTVEGGDGVAGWQIRYVDDPVANGRGDPVDVEGDAVIEVTLTGMALPPMLDEDVWDEDAYRVGGEGIVEVVDAGVFEGRHQLFVGTTGLNHVVVDRAEDPQRVLVDVAHGSP
jgi:hypothetical protein